MFMYDVYHLKLSTVLSFDSGVCETMLVEYVVVPRYGKR